MYEYQSRHPWTVILGAIFALIMSAQLMGFVGNEFSPSTDANEITITARAPMGSVFAKSESIAKEIENRLTQFPEIESTTIKIGDKGLQNIDIKLTSQSYFQLHAPSQQEIAKVVTDSNTPIPGKH